MNNSDERRRPIDEIIDLCAWGSIEQIREEIESAIADDEDFVGQTSDFGESPLHTAAEYGRLSVVNMLIDDFGYDANQPNYYGGISVYLAIRTGNAEARNYEVAMRLCEVTSDWDGLQYSRWQQKLPSSEIQQCTDLISKMIANGCDINFISERDRGFHPLYHAVQNDDVEMVRILIQLGVDVEWRDDKGVRGRDCLLACKSREVASLLIEKGCDVNCFELAPYLSWRTPLTEALRGGHYDVARYFIDQGARVDINEKEMVWDLLRGAKSFVRIADSMEEKYSDVFDAYGNLEVDEYEWEDLRCAHFFNEAAKLVNKMHIDDDTKTMIVDLCRDAKSREEALELQEYIERVETETKLRGLLHSDLVKEANLPLSIVRMIASPLKWH